MRHYVDHSPIKQGIDFRIIKEEAHKHESTILVFSLPLLLLESAMLLKLTETEFLK